MGSAELDVCECGQGQRFATEDSTRKLHEVLILGVIKWVQSLAFLATTAPLLFNQGTNFSSLSLASCARMFTFVPMGSLSLPPSFPLSLPLSSSPSLPPSLSISLSMCLCLSRTLGQSKPTNKMLLPEDTRARLVDRAGDASLAPTSASTSIAWEKRGSRAPRSTSGVSAPSAPRSPRPPLPFLDALPVMVSRTPSP